MINIDNKNYQRILHEFEIKKFLFEEKNNENIWNLIKKKALYNGFNEFEIINEVNFSIQKIISPIKPNFSILSKINLI